MNREEIKKKVFEVIRRRVIDWYDGDITEEMTYHEMDCDSLDAVELMMDIEREFHISPRDAEWNDAKTIGQWVDLVVKHLRNGR